METRVKNILVGSLLGDGWLTKIKSKTETSCYSVKYNDRALGYLCWLQEQVRELNPSPIKAKPEVRQHYFYTSYRADLGEFRKKFYPNDIKHVPKDISELLTDPIGLAIWYQDDGTLDRRSGYHWNAHFATYCFPYDDCVLLRDTVAQNFGIEMSVCRCQMRGKMYYLLYVQSRSMKLFIETVRPYVHQNYAYKIHRLN